MRKKTVMPGFTLMELLIVIVLLGSLSVLGLTMFQGSQKRTRDTRRKSDLKEITKALEMYVSDYNRYPASSDGYIMGCEGAGEEPVSCLWGNSWSRGSTYMQKLPRDLGSTSYCYELDPSAGKWYKLYAKLEGTDNPDYDASLICAGSSYTYVLLSPNLTPTPTP